ncbi:hypothetical protein JB92DRAFT_704414 [Gautieria morchelliformis]|nr:hypothetical protein JB92DRAFT_704414 [Gautieria morchelliformis]
MQPQTRPTPTPPSSIRVRTDPVLRQAQTQTQMQHAGARSSRQAVRQSTPSVCTSSPTQRRPRTSPLDLPAPSTRQWTMQPLTRPIAPPPSSIRISTDPVLRQAQTQTQMPHARARPSSRVEAEHPVRLHLLADPAAPTQVAARPSAIQQWTAQLWTPRTPPPPSSIRIRTGPDLPLDKHRARHARRRSTSAILQWTAQLRTRAAPPPPSSIRIRTGVHGSDVFGYEYAHASGAAG